MIDKQARMRANKKLVDALLALWNEHPDQRLGQLVMNLSRNANGFADTWEWKHGRWYDAIQHGYDKWSA